MRIAFLCEYPSLNGGERSLLSTLPGLRVGGVDPMVLAPASGELARALAREGIRHLPCTCFDPLTRVRRRGEEARDEVRRALVGAGADLVHANSLSMARLAGPVAADLGLPSLGHLRDILRLSRAAVDDLCRNDRLLAVSRATRAWHVAQGLPEGKVRVVHNGIDTDVLRPAPHTGHLHAELGIDEQCPILLSVGQLGLRKGLDVLLEACSAIFEDVADVHLALVGERSSDKEEAVHHEAELLRRARLPGLRGRCHFLGRREDVARLLLEATLLVHAARQEPLGRVLLEAGAAGLAVVATRVGGTPEIFPPGSGTASLVDKDDPRALAAAVTRLLRDPGQRVVMSRRARARIEVEFGVERCVKDLLRHYEEVLSGGGRSRDRNGSPGTIAKER